VIRVEQGKGKKDRYTVLAERSWHSLPARPSRERNDCRAPEHTPGDDDSAAVRVPPVMASCARSRSSPRLPAATTPHDAAPLVFRTYPKSQRLEPDRIGTVRPAGEVFTPPRRPLASPATSSVLSQRPPSAGPLASPCRQRSCLPLTTAPRYNPQIARWGPRWSAVQFNGAFPSSGARRSTRSRDARAPDDGKTLLRSA